MEGLRFDGGTCDETGARTRSATTFTCRAGTCEGTESTETRRCTRSTNGTSCGATSCGSWSPCGGFSGTCDETGTQSRTCTDPVCMGGACGSSSRTETRSCTRSTNGTACEDGDPCTLDDHCLSGACVAGRPCECCLDTCIGCGCLPCEI